LVSLAEPIPAYHHYTIESNGVDYLVYSDASDMYFDVAFDMDGYLDLYWTDDLTSNDWDCVLFGTEPFYGTNTFRVYMSTNSVLTQEMMDSASGFFVTGYESNEIINVSMDGFEFTPSEMKTSPAGTLPPEKPWMGDSGITPPTSTPVPVAIGLPLETFSIQVLGGEHEIHIFDYSNQTMLSETPYEHTGYVEFNLPAWSCNRSVR
jgi:hypothetical protein